MNAPNNAQLAEAYSVPAGEPAWTTAARRRRIAVNVLRSLFLVVLIGGWELAARLGWIDSFFFGQPSRIAAQIWTWVTKGTAQGPLWQQIAATMEETVFGFLIGVVLGIVFGIALGRNRLLADVLGPYIKGANAIPRVVLGSIFIIWLGLGMQSKVALAVVLVFFVVFFNAFQGVREVDKNFVANARILGASRLQVVRNVVIPSALTWIIASLHVAFGFAVIGAIVGEFLGAQKGLGLIISTAQNNFDADGVFAAMLIIGVIALTAEWLIGLMERRLLAWRPQVQTEAQGI